MVVKLLKTKYLLLVKPIFFLLFLFLHSLLLRLLELRRVGRDRDRCRLDDLEQALMPVKMMLSFYIGGMGAKKRNFHTELMGRMGFEAEANKIQELFMEGKRAEAVATVPDQFADEISLCGPRERVVERLQAWEETPVTSLLVASPEIATLRQMAEIVL